MSRSATSGRSAIEDVTTDQIETSLLGLLAAAQAEGERFLDVTSGALHRTTGGTSKSSRGVPLCCRVMRRVMSLPEDVQLSALHTGNSATLLIRYALPRRAVPTRPKQAAANNGVLCE